MRTWYLLYDDEDQLVNRCFCQFIAARWIKKQGNWCKKCEGQGKKFKTTCMVGD